ncbi:MAG: PhzF family phenazine biosynthesis protein [Aestuariibacter sp.]
MRIAERYAGFSQGEQGGNPAGVLITQSTLSESEMLMIAKNIGDSETVFAVPKDNNHFLIRYFAPEAEVDFCGHATIALGKAIANHFGAGQYSLETNKGILALSASQSGDIFFKSPATSSRPLKEDELRFIWDNSSLSPEQLDSQYYPAMVNAGNDHALLVVRETEHVSRFEYDFDAFKTWMQSHQVVTLAVAVISADGEIRIRNAFAFGGVYEDPATGAAAAAVSGYLRDNKLTELGQLTFTQGVEMGQTSVLRTSFSNEKGSAIGVGGSAYFLSSVADC